MRRVIVSCVTVLSVVAGTACGSSGDPTGTGGSTGTSGDTGTGSTGTAMTTTSATGTGGGGTGGSSGLGPAPHTIVYAGTSVGVDMRETTDDSFNGLALTSYVASADERPELGTNQVKDASGDAFAVIGRWAGGTTGGKLYNAGNMGLLDFPANGGFQYAIGQGSDSLPSSGVTAYTLKSKTTATVSDGSLSPGTISGSLAADFTGAGSKIGFSLTLDLPGDATYTIATTGGAANPSTSGTVVDAFVKGSFAANIPITSTGAACKSGAVCTGTVFGFVAGPNADRVALVAHVFAGAGGSPKSVSGANVFSR
jgi:hypothetical protein